jgi:P4 family phage/plasmid primase-like protien
MAPSPPNGSGVLDVGRGGGNLEISATGVNKLYSRWGNREYRELKLLEAVRVLGKGRGLKSVIVDNEKRPIHKWRDALPSIDELEGIVKNNENAEGVAIIGDVLPHDPLHVLVILDVDDVDNGFKVLEAVFGTGWRERLLGGPDSFVVLTGPRPKDAWECDCEAPGVDCQCRNKQTGEVRQLSELERGLAIGIRVPVTCAPSSCIKGEAIEVRARNCYEVVFGRHPSGAFYQPVKWENNRFVGIELWQLGSGAVVSCEEFEKLLKVIKGVPVEEEEEVGGDNINNKDNNTGLPEAQANQAQVTQQAQATPAPKSIKYQKLSEEKKREVIEALRRFYKSGTRQNLWLALGGWGAWHHIHPVDIADILARLYKETNDTDDLRVRGAAIIYSYAKRGLPVSKEELAQVLGVEPYGPEALPEEKVSWKSLLKEALGVNAKEVIKALRRVVRRSLLTREERRKLLAMLRRGKTANAALVMTRLVKRRFRYIINPQTPEGADLGLHCWDGRRYKGCEKDIESFIARVYEAVVGDKTVRVSYTRLKDEALELLKDGARKVMPSEKALIAFENCVFDWEELQCIPHDPRHFVLHYIPHPLDQSALREALDKGLTPELAQKYTPKVLKATMEWVGDKWTLLYEILGMILYPRPYKKAVLFIGPTDSGKSTCINLYKEVIGKENYSAVPLQSLTSMEGRFVASSIYPKLANFWADLPKKAVEDVGMFKVLTGGDAIFIDKKHREPFMWTPYTKFVFSANDPPPVRDADEAFWNRWLVVDFTPSFASKIKNFERTLLDEAPQFLALGIAAFVKVLERGSFSFENTAEDARIKWMTSVNTVFGFIEWLKGLNALVKDPAGRVKVKELYTYYTRWCEVNGRAPVAPNIFTMELARLGFETKAPHRERQIIGYRLERGIVEQALGINNGNEELKDEQQGGV